MDEPRFSILLNARPLSTVFTGVARYARTLYQNIERLDTVRVSYFCNGRVSETMPEQSKDVLSRHFPVWVRHVARHAKLAAEDRLLRSEFRKGCYDIYHETGSFSLTTSTAVAKILTIYDLSLITYPECHPRDRVDYFKRYFYKRLPSIDHVATISEFIRGEIIDLLHLPPDKVTAVPLAASATFYRRPEQEVGDFLESQGIPDQYILTVGTREPRKNLLGLVRAYSSMDTDIPLLCVGWSGWMSENLPQEIDRLRLRNRIKILGHLTDEELALLYSGAHVTVYPSLYEGFGLPILEAMACGCPVVCSNRSSMPEVAGGAAVLVDPEDEADIAAGLSRVIDDAVLRQSCIDKGYARERQFSWEQTAAKTMELFRNVASRR